MYHHPDWCFAHDRVPIEAGAGDLPGLAGQAGTDGALLLSDGTPALGRRSVLALWPYLEFSHRRGESTVRSDSGWSQTQVSSRPLRAFDQLLATQASPELRDPHTRGAIGFIGYDFGHELLGLPRRAARPGTRVPDIFFRFHRCHVVLDHGDGRAEAHLTGVGNTPREAGRDLRQSALRLQRLMRSGRAGAGPQTPANRRRPGSIRMSLDRPAYARKIRQILDYIRRGHVYQVNFSHPFEWQWDEPGHQILEHLFAVNPVPFGAWIPFPGGEIVSLSPECFLRRAGRQLATVPIKGTRPRGREPAEDRRLTDDLLSSPKDGAELAMIVDLERNDLGRICRSGTVQVTRHRELVTFPTLHHTASVVTGDLVAGTPLSRILEAVFPGGSITGVPKKRCVEIIAEMEEAEREIYTGAIGFVQPNGDCVFNLAIRTLLKEGPLVRFRMGGGIVCDSDPEAEYEETLHKARAFYLATGGEMP